MYICTGSLQEQYQYCEKGQDIFYQFENWCSLVVCSGRGYRRGREESDWPSDWVSCAFGFFFSMRARSLIRLTLKRGIERSPFYLSSCFFFLDTFRLIQGKRGEVCHWYCVGCFSFSLSFYRKLKGKIDLRAEPRQSRTIYQRLFLQLFTIFFSCGSN